MRRLMDEWTSAVQTTLRYAKALEGDPPAIMSDKQKRNLAAFNNTYESRLRRRQRERYHAALRQIHADQQKVEDRLGESEKQVADIEDKVSSGRITGEEGRRQLTFVFRQIKDDRAVLDALDASAERATEMIDTDPATHQEQMLDRFPNLAGNLPVLSVAWLNGDHSQDPFGALP